MGGFLCHGSSGLTPLERPYVYGVKWTKSSTSSTLTRTDDSANFTFTPQKVSGGSVFQEGSSSFDELPIYKDIRLCNVVNGVATAYEGDSDFSYTPARGDVMVEIPRFYYIVTDSDTELSIKISNVQLEGYHISPLHRPLNENLSGEEKAYVTAYFLDKDGRSSGAAAALDSEITLPSSWPDGGYGNGYIPSSVMTQATIMLLYLVEVANFDSQTAVCDVGFSDDKDINGKSAELGYHSGGDETAKWCVYRHIENLWGKTPMALYGTIAFHTLNLLYKESPWNNNAAETSAKVPVGYVEENTVELDDVTANADGEENETPAYVDTGTGYVSKLVPDSDIPGILIPNQTSSTAGGIPDQYVTSGLGVSDYLTLYWGAVSSVPAAPVTQNFETISSVDYASNPIKKINLSVKSADYAEQTEEVVESSLTSGTLDEEVGDNGEVIVAPYSKVGTPKLMEAPVQPRAGELDPPPPFEVQPIGAGGIFSMVSTLGLDCFYRMTYLPGLSQKKTFTAKFVDRDGDTIKEEVVSALYPFVQAPDENPTWNQGFFTGWIPDPEMAISFDTTFEPQFVMGQEKKLPVLGRYDSLEALQQAVPNPTQGDLYEIGTTAPYKVYIYVTADGWVDTMITQ